MEDPELAQQLDTSYQSHGQPKTDRDDCKTVICNSDCNCDCLPPSKNAQDDGQWLQNDVSDVQSKDSGDSDLVLAGKGIYKTATSYISLS